MQKLIHASCTFLYIFSTTYKRTSRPANISFTRIQSEETATILYTIDMKSHAAGASFKRSSD